MFISNIYFRPHPIFCTLFGGGGSSLPLTCTVHASFVCLSVSTLIGSRAVPKSHFSYYRFRGAFYTEAKSCILLGTDFASFSNTKQYYDRQYFFAPSPFFGFLISPVQSGLTVHAPRGDGRVYHLKEDYYCMLRIHSFIHSV